MGDAVKPLLPFGYTGQQQDAESGLIYLRARYMDPTTGRFMSRDTFAGYASRPQSQNRYGYGEGNPVNRTDPSGHCAGALAIPCAGAAAGGAVAGPPGVVIGAAVGGVIIFGIIIAGVQQPPTTQEAAFPRVPWTGPQPPKDWTQSPGPGFEWQGKGDPGSQQGSWHNKETGESWHKDATHHGELHGDYVDANGTRWRVYYDGTAEQKGNDKKDEPKPQPNPGPVKN